MKKIETVAIIDDDDIYQYMAKKTILSTKKIETISIFSDGQEAIDFFHENVDHDDLLPDLIFLDLNMPVIDGWQFLEQYKLLKPMINKKIVIYIVTSSLNPDDLITAKSITEVTDYIVKPISQDKFIEIIHNR